jgi:hypothetical protein
MPISTDKQLAVTYVKRAEVNLDLNDIPSALQDLSTAIEKDPTYARVRTFQTLTRPSCLLRSALTPLILMVYFPGVPCQVSGWNAHKEP